MFTESQLESFTAGYITALLWSSTIEDAQGEYVNADTFQLSTTAADRCRADCRAFVEAYHHYLEEATDLEGYNWEQAGHDFALTRNGHGSGYWDRDEMSCALSDALTEYARCQGEVNLFLNDSLEVELS